VATVENVVITDPGFAGIGVTSTSSDSPSAIVRHTTIARVAGPTDVDPLLVQVQNVNGYRDASLTATGTIIRGFDSTYFRFAPTDLMVGDANLSLSYSNFVPAGTDIGDGTLTLGPGNINLDPLFAGPSDFHLLAGSPSIDAADPLPAVPVNEDFDGALRPVDGNGDCAPRADMGAYELQLPPPAACLPPPAATPMPTTTPATPAKKKCKKKKRRQAAAAKKCKRKKR
jgi:hypothetical protein